MDYACGIFYSQAWLTFCLLSIILALHRIGVPLANITFVLMILVIYWPQLREFAYVNVTLE